MRTPDEVSNRITGGNSAIAQLLALVLPLPGDIVTRRRAFTEPFPSDGRRLRTLHPLSQETLDD